MLPLRNREHLLQIGVQIRFKMAAKDISTNHIFVLTAKCTIYSEHTAHLYMRPDDPPT